LITYHEIAQLADSQFSAMNTQEHLSIAVTHELAHQWFGNLVVCFYFDTVK